MRSIWTLWLFMGHVELCAFVLCSVMIVTASAEELLHSFRGSVGSGNYTYYKMHREGTVRLVLVTQKGDTDLYCSSRTLQPVFDNYDFDVSSVTCGVDVIQVPKEMERPVGIGVYGHPAHAISTYILHVYALDEYSTSGRKSSNHNPGESEEESLIWTVIVTILKIVFDILL